MAALPFGPWIAHYDLHQHWAEAVYLCYLHWSWWALCPRVAGSGKNYGFSAGFAWKIGCFFCKGGEEPKSTAGDRKDCLTERVNSIKDSFQTPGLQAWISTKLLDISRQKAFFREMTTCGMCTEFSHTKCLVQCEVSANGTRTLIGLVTAVSVMWLPPLRQRYHLFIGLPTTFLTTFKYFTFWWWRHRQKYFKWVFVCHLSGGFTFSKITNIQAIIQLYCIQYIQF